ncbi:cardiolipin synthase ClsB [Extensimonas vulgaris]|jgi:cardiolipin synthase|uniref:Cardiolipin synthase B n=1 Tax=Extensimonas vulgaris TaxID=1031594 RepID=A0A369AQL3_9BURK|nr:cardiolipin synthase ClsB [Extensimonas vulgaris]RCX11662.1 cardiolipin synthase [Extensimonas vulgaris]TWI40557.1 cardiolipin synthase [Extensimonas vulgaris]TXD16570.1 cardiolipin synthase ClsB [Extensimonas vulgaris]
MAPAATFAKDHHLRLLQGAQELFPALVRAMDAALSDIQLETYIFDFTGAAVVVAEALERAARRGVRTHVVVDGVGTGRLPQEWARRFQEAGVQWRVYAAPGWFGLLSPRHWRRLHRKLCVVDGWLLFCGGINILDDFHDPNHGPLAAPRLDFAVEVAGSLVAQASEAMEQLWWHIEAVRDLRRRDLPEAVRALRAASAARHAARLRRDASSVRAALVLRDNLRHRGRIEKAYLRAIATARQEIIIANAYFIPGHKLRRALVHAARRGVRVRLLLQGRYEYFMQYHAAKPVYGVLLEAGVEIHEYAPSFLHAKVAVIDAQGEKPWATVGSSNLEPLSLLLAREANVVVEDGAFACELRARLVHAMEHAGQRVDPARYLQRPLRERVLDWLAHGLMRLALWVTGKRY